MSIYNLFIYYSLNFVVRLDLILIYFITQSLMGCIILLDRNKTQVCPHKTLTLTTNDALSFHLYAVN